jgi:uncharacterized protein YjcR
VFLIYDTLERDLERLCKELGMNHANWVCPDGFAKDIEKMSHKELAYKYGVTAETIGHWKRRLGISPRRRPYVQYSLLDNLIQQKLPAREIAEKAGCSLSTVKKYRQQKYGKLRAWTRNDNTEVHVEKAEPIIPPAIRLSLAIKVKKHNLHMTNEQMAVWLQGQGGRQFLRGIAL